MKYETTNIVFAAYFRNVGYAISEIRLDGRQGVFIFDDVEQSDIDAITLGSAHVEPVAFYDMIRQLTTVVKKKV